MPQTNVVLSGNVAPGFEPVADEFRRNFAERSELGAAFAATLDGEVIVDLWGGFTDPDRKRVWDADTPVLLFSGTKTLVAVCLLMLLERGELELQVPVAHYWPEFGANGKAEITVADLVSHRARLPAMRVKVDEEELAEPVKMAELLAAQAPETDRRCGFIYHAITYGWLCGELLRRVDGRSLGRFFAEEIAEPLGLEIWIGLPPERLADVATMVYSADFAPDIEHESALIAEDDLLNAICNNPVLYPPDRVIWNSPRLLSAEIPAINGVGTPRSVARLFGCLARGGEIEGVRLLEPETIEVGRRELSRGHNVLGSGPIAFGFGFQLQTSTRTYGPPADAFGHDGFGGSRVGAWPSDRVGFCYAMNYMMPDDRPDPRGKALLWALYSCVEGTR
jgi:CubicO group peptidase (beta-lactamase class C family)